MPFSKLIIGKSQVFKLGSMTPYGRRTKTGSSGQDKVSAGAVWGVLNVMICHEISQSEDKTLQTSRQIDLLKK